MNPFRNEPSVAIPKGVWALGFVSMFMDMSSEMIHALLPVFMVTAFGATPVWVGLVEGIAEATAAIMKVFSGTLSDRLRRRKLLAVIGYGLATLTKPVFPLAGSLAWLVAARFVDRIGKGIRGAPRDALVADLTPQSIRGAAFGLRQSLDSIGAILGPLLAIGLMALLSGDIRLVFWCAAIPAIISVAILIVAVREPEQAAGGPVRPLPAWRDATRLGAAFWIVTFVGTAMAFARFSEAFLVLKAADSGLSLMLVPLVLVIMNVLYALTSYPAGHLSDRIGRNALLAVGLVLLIAADLVLAMTSGIVATLLGVCLWGLHMGLTQGILSAMVADTAPPALRGTAFGVFNLGQGISALAASLLAGILWQWHGPSATFLAGAGFSLLALFGMLARPPRSHGSAR